MKYSFWFVVGSQFLYGPEVLDTVAARAEEMAKKLSGYLRVLFDAEPTSVGGKLPGEDFCYNAAN